VARAIRAGDEAAASGRSSAQLTPADALAALREAVETSAPVVITYVDNHGTLADRVVAPVRVEGGQLVALDRRADETRSFAVHRIRDVRPAER
jgi:predicted DNA-binding transcriptional regulator YafY